jgi:hypothetical protein
MDSLAADFKRTPSEKNLACIHLRFRGHDSDVTKRFELGWIETAWKWKDTEEAWWLWRGEVASNMRCSEIKSAPLAR